MKLYQKIIIVIVVSIIAIFGAYVNWINQFIIVGVAFFVSTFFLIDNKIKKWLTVLILLFPFLSVCGGVVLHGVLLHNYSFLHIYPTLLISIISAFLGLSFKLLYLKHLQKKILIFVSIYLLFFIAGGYIFMHNWLNYVFHEEALQTEAISDIKIWDFSNNEIQLGEMENKVIVLDFWTTYCGWCFKKFPDLEKVKNHYNHKDVVFYAVYVPKYCDERENSNLEERLKWIEEQNYTFNVVKTDTTTANQLGIRGYPHLIVYDKNKKAVFNDSFSLSEKRVVINNLYSTIDKSLKK